MGIRPYSGHMTSSGLFHGRRLPALMVVMVLAALALAAPTRAADTELAEPLPDWDNPRRILLQLTENDPARVNGVFSNAANILDFYGMDNVEVAIVAYGAGVRALLRESAPAADRVASLGDYGVEFVACGNTLKTIGKSEDDLLPGVDMVTAGIPEIVERRLRGWHYIVP